MSNGKFQMCIAKETLQAIDDWSFKNRIRSRAEAVRRLVSLGLKSTNASNKTRSEN